MTKIEVTTKKGKVSVSTDYKYNNSSCVKAFVIDVIAQSVRELNVKKGSQ